MASYAEFIAEIWKIVVPYGLFVYYQKRFKAKLISLFK